MATVAVMASPDEDLSDDNISLNLRLSDNDDTESTTSEKIVDKSDLENNPEFDSGSKEDDLLIKESEETIVAAEDFGTPGNSETDNKTADNVNKSEITTSENNKELVLTTTSDDKDLIVDKTSENVEMEIDNDETITINNVEEVSEKVVTNGCDKTKSELPTITSATVEKPNLNALPDNAETKQKDCEKIDDSQKMEDSQKMDDSFAVVSNEIDLEATLLLDNDTEMEGDNSGETVDEEALLNEPKDNEEALHTETKDNEEALHNEQKHNEEALLSEPKDNEDLLQVMEEISVDNDNQDFIDSNNPEEEDNSCSSSDKCDEENAASSTVKDNDETVENSEETDVIMEENDESVDENDETVDENDETVEENDETVEENDLVVEENDVTLEENEETENTEGIDIEDNLLEFDDKVVEEKAVEDAIVEGESTKVEPESDLEELALKVSDKTEDELENKIVEEDKMLGEDSEKTTVVESEKVPTDTVEEKVDETMTENDVVKDVIEEKTETLNDAIVAVVSEKKQVTEVEELEENSLIVEDDAMDEVTNVVETDKVVETVKEVETNKEVETVKEVETEKEVEIDKEEETNKELETVKEVETNKVVETNMIEENNSNGDTTKELENTVMDPIEKVDSSKPAETNTDELKQNGSSNKVVETSSETTMQIEAASCVGKVVERLPPSANPPLKDTLSSLCEMILDDNMDTVEEEDNTMETEENVVVVSNRADTTAGDQGNSQHSDDMDIEEEILSTQITTSDTTTLPAAADKNSLLRQVLSTVSSADQPAVPPVLTATNMVAVVSPPTVGINTSIADGIRSQPGKLLYLLCIPDGSKTTTSTTTTPIITSSPKITEITNTATTTETTTTNTRSKHKTKPASKTEKRRSNEVLSNIETKKRRVEPSSKILRSSTSNSQSTLNGLGCFEKFMVRGELQKITRGELEEFVLQKVCEALVHRTEIGELKQKLRVQEQMVDTWRKETVIMAKQIRDMNIIHQRLGVDIQRMKEGSNKPLVPIKITRSVGLQALIEDPRRKLRVIAPSPQPQQQQTQQQQPPQRASPVVAAKASDRVVPVSPATVTKVAPTKTYPPPTRNSTASSRKQTAIAPKPVTTKPSPQPKAGPQRVLQQPVQVQQQNHVSKQLVKVAGTNVPPPPLVKTSGNNKGVIDLTDEDDRNAANNVTQTRITLVPTTMNGKTVMLKVAGNPNLSNGATVTFPQPPTLVSSSRPPLKSKSRSTRANGTHLTNGVGGILTTTTTTPPSKQPSATVVLMHPAALPPIPPGQHLIVSRKPTPPRPQVNLTKTATGSSGIVVQWKMPGKLSLYESIASYQLFAYQETRSPPRTDNWGKIGDVKALDLPMAVTLTEFAEGNRYYFAVRAVDVMKRLGPFSDPQTILL